VPSATSEFDEAYDDLGREPPALTGDVLDQPIRILEPREAVLVRSSASVAMLNDRNAGCLLVMENDRLAGIFTDRDIVRRVLPTGIALGDIAVREYMTPAPEVLSPDDPIAFALNRILNGGFRHVPLLDDARRPVGVVSIRDVVNFVIAHFAAPVQNLPPSPSRSPNDAPPHGAA
jgi:signal-transduction protein with cAMP-binding, CBS, and nucleotidyltransferase domain